jgi:protein-L-isoaspartate(D-aspartate) O-methyltransferase
VSAALSRELEAMGIRDPRVLAAVARVPRRLFVPESLREEADKDRPLPIGWGQTISQPFVVAYMTDRLELAGTERVLEVGTGSGYQTALLALLARQVFSIEIVPELCEHARQVLLGVMGLENVELATGDGRRGWPAAAPFDRIIVTAAALRVPEDLVDQLAPGGRMILPVGGQDLGGQVLRLVEKGSDGMVETEDLLPVRFVPLTGGPRGA